MKESGRFATLSHEEMLDLIRILQKGKFNLRFVLTHELPRSPVFQQLLKRKGVALDLVQPTGCCTLAHVALLSCHHFVCWPQKSHTTRITSHFAS